MANFITAKKDVDDCVNKEFDPDDPYKPVRDLQCLAMSDAGVQNYEYARIILEIAKLKMKEVEIETSLHLLNLQIGGVP
ncbi:MAG: hypothetical protein HYT12_03425 [Candidatus Liptonbacteria bacterium]|nr:hypothetical protein [Candidatus Liptonbacteria bacterium]